MPPAASPLPQQPSLAEQLTDDDVKTLQDGVSPEAVAVLTRIVPELASVLGNDNEDNADDQGDDQGAPDEADNGPSPLPRPKTGLSRY